MGVGPGAAFDQGGVVLDAGLRFVEGGGADVHCCGDGGEGEGSGHSGVEDALEGSVVGCEVEFEAEEVLVEYRCDELRGGGWVVFGEGGAEVHEGLEVVSFACENGMSENEEEVRGGMSVTFL